MKVTVQGPVQGKMDDAKFSTAIDAAGHGKFQYLALSAAGLIYFAAGLQSGTNAYILPSVKCAFQLSDSQMGVLNALFLGGGTLSAHFWGALSDSYGRRPVLAGTAMLDAACIVCSAFAPNFTVFAVTRLVSGMLNMAAAGMTFLYMGEFVGGRHRSTFSQLIGSVWIGSWIVLPGLAWLVIPQPWSVRVEALGLDLQSWRVFLLLLLLPMLGSAAFALHMPETPKFLQSAGREEDALRVYRRIYAINTGDSPDNYPVRQLRMPVGAKQQADSGGHVGRLLRTLTGTLRLSLELFRPPVLYRTALCCLIYFCSMFVAYGFGYWLPELLNRYKLDANTHPGEREYVCNAITASANSSSSVASTTLLGVQHHCGDASVVDPVAFLNTAVVNSASMAIVLVSSLATGYVGRRTLCASSNVLAGVAGFGLLYASSSVEVVAAAIFFSALAEVGCVAINGMIVDIFPPRVSAVGVASVMLSGRLGGSMGNLAIGYLLEQSCEVPLLLMFGTAIVCGLLCCCAHRRFAEDDDKEPKDEVVGIGGESPVMTPQSA